MSKSKLKRLAIQQAPAPEPTQTNKEAWWAGYRVGKGLPPDTPRHEAVDAPAPEPYGYCVYFPDEQRQEWCNDLDELVDDLTNCRHEITPLYAHPAAPAPSATVDEVMALAHRMKDAAIGWGDVYTAMQALRAAVEQIVSLNTTLAGMVASAEEQRDRQARRAEHAERERDAERDGRDAMDSAARCNHAAVEQIEQRALRAEHSVTVCKATIDALAFKIDKAEQEAAANKQDAIRYRWLRKVGCPLLVVKPSSAYGDLQMDEATLDRAIDAALKEGK